MDIAVCDGWCDSGAVTAGSIEGPVMFLVVAGVAAGVARAWHPPSPQVLPTLQGACSATPGPTAA